MRVFIFLTVRKRLRVSTPILPNVACLLASLTLIPASVRASETKPLIATALNGITMPDPFAEPPLPSAQGAEASGQASDPTSLYQKGVKAYTSGNYSAAIEALTKFTATAAPGNLRDANLYLGDAYAASKDYEHAIPAYTSYISENPEQGSYTALVRPRGMRT